MTDQARTLYDCGAVLRTYLDDLAARRHPFAGTDRKLDRTYDTRKNAGLEQQI